MAEPNIVRKLMAATVTDERFLKGLRTIWRENLVGPAWLWLAGKSFSYLDEFGSAPGRNIEALWEADTILEREVKDDLGRLFAGLSEEWESGPELNPELLLQEAELYFARELYLQKAVELETAAEAGDIEAAEKIVEEAKPPRLIQVTGLNPFRDRDGLSKAFSQKDTPLVKLGGILQEEVGRQIIRDSFVAFLGKEKVGKTWMLQSIVYAGLKAGSNVLFCQCGDLSASQQRLRLAVQLTGRNYKPQYCGPLLSPVPDCLRSQDGSCENRPNGVSESIITKRDENKPYPKLERYEVAKEYYDPCPNMGCHNRLLSSWWEPVDSCEVLTEAESWDSCQRFDKAIGDRLRLECFASKEKSLTDIRAMYDRIYDATGWKPDIVVLDYADNLAACPHSGKDFRHQESSKWENFRRWSQDWKICLVTATQAPKKTRYKRLLCDEDMSEDKRKKAHVTAFFGLNKDDHDKRRGWLRINPLVIREDDYDPWDQVTVLQLIQRGRPNIGSYWFRKGGDE